MDSHNYRSRGMPAREVQRARGGGGVGAWENFASVHKIVTIYYKKKIIFSPNNNSFITTEPVYILFWICPLTPPHPLYLTTLRRRSMDTQVINTMAVPPAALLGRKNRSSKEELVTEHSMACTGSETGQNR